MTKNLLVSTSIALGVLTFVMLSGHFFRAFDLLARGVSPWLLCQFLGLMVPDMLRFSLPLSILVATVLVFGRMSSDNEIVALKASGINLWQIITPGLLLCLAGSILCLGISLVVSPICRYEADKLRWTALTNTPLSILEPNVFTKLSNQCHLRIQSQDRDELRGIHIILQSSSDTMQDITAQSGRLHVNTDEQHLDIELHDASISDIAFGHCYAVTKRHLTAEVIRLPMDYGSSQNKKKITRKSKYLDLKMIFGRIKLLRQGDEDVTRLMLDLHGRLSLSLSPFAFLLLGIPFGIRGKRSEISVGLLICVILALGFYMFMLLADMLEKKPELHPELITWLPNLLYQAGGLIAIHKIGKH